MTTSRATWLSSLVVALVAAAPAHAEVRSTTGEIRQEPAPDDVRLDRTVSDANIIVFDEAQDVPTTTNLDAMLDYEAGVSVVIGEGTIVDSHMLHLDLPGTDMALAFGGTVTFADPIVGFLVDADDLLNTDETLGAEDTTYGEDIDRGLDLGSDTARVTADPRVLEVYFRTDTKLDQLRVLTAADDVELDAGALDADAAWDGSGDGATTTPPDDSDGVQFRGAGGCACDATRSPTTHTHVFLVTAFLVLLARRRT